MKLGYHGAIPPYQACVNVPKYVNCFSECLFKNSFVTYLKQDLTCECRVSLMVIIGENL